MLCRSGRDGRRVDVVLARDADDADVTEAFAAALLTSGIVTLPGAQVGHTLRAGLMHLQASIANEFWMLSGCIATAVCDEHHCAGTWKYLSLRCLR